jgi:hypothetical protein
VVSAAERFAGGGFAFAHALNEFFVGDLPCRGAPCCSSLQSHRPQWLGGRSGDGGRRRRDRDVLVAGHASVVPGRHGVERGKEGSITGGEQFRGGRSENEKWDILGQNVTFRICKSMA